MAMMLTMNAMTFLQNDAVEDQTRSQMETGILTPEARAFLLKLGAALEPRRQELLARRRTAQQDIDNGKLPDFLPESAGIRQGDWRVAPIPKDLRDRRVEITGPVDRKMIINALNSGANVFMADFEDSNSPTWQNNVEGQINLRDTVNGTISYTSPEGKQYRLAESTATFLIETIIAAFEMDEILYELRDHSSGLNCGRWDYIFSFIKKFRNRPDFLLPNRAEVTMERHFLKSYVELLIQICHRRGIHAMGGMAAQVPIKNDPAANEQALDKVRKDKLREVRAGHDGTWVAHPGLVAIAKEIFDAGMPEPNQIGRVLEDKKVTPQDLLTVPDGAITEAGLRWNIDVGLRYVEAWLRGLGCVPIYNLMEDAATAEICRSQVWQWVKHGAHFDDGRAITAEFVRHAIGEQLVK